MNRIGRMIGVAIGLLFTSKNAAAVAAAAAAGVTASTIAFDPIPWAIGAAGGTVVHAYRAPQNRSKTLANGVICVFLGGVGSPFVGAIVQHHFGPLWANQYVLAGVLSVSWPWAAPIVWDRLVLMFRAMTGGKKNG